MVKTIETKVRLFDGIAEEINQCAKKHLGEYLTQEVDWTAIDSADIVPVNKLHAFINLIDDKEKRLCVLKFLRDFGGDFFKDVRRPNTFYLKEDDFGRTTLDETRAYLADFQKEVQVQIRLLESAQEYTPASSGVEDGSDKAQENLIPKKPWFGKDISFFRTENWSVEECYNKLMNYLSSSDKNAPVIAKFDSTDGRGFFNLNHSYAERARLLNQFCDSERFSAQNFADYNRKKKSTKQ